MEDDLDFVPEWGQLPVEQYLIRYWDHSSPQSPEQQRSTLIKQFLQLDKIQPEWDATLFTSDDWKKPNRIPTPDEISNILQPWRSDELRRIAWRIWGCNNVQPLLLRTHYDPKHDESVREWHDLDEYENESWRSILDNQDIFNFGADWKRVFTIFPEAAGYLGEYPRWPDIKFIKKFQALFKQSLDGVKRRNKQTWKQDLNASLIQANPGAWFLLQSIRVGYILIADEEAFQTNHFLLVYFDGNQNVIAQGRVLITDEGVKQVLLDWDQGEPPYSIFEEGTIGEKYLVDGEMGSWLYAFTKDDLENDPPAPAQDA
ncbi:hypothetical protein ASPSYDRAFT_94782 [Aspergillus sydowii CBS 593.65]|uniref:Uncharacterized protein n=1 Tax=Aspergillus sydowii CBS 593.65 TaxID=1036612 RepID=A0A1L9T2A8_9EURO|nr:uncharacterized protein ASPSYDRAFT_94782 [Aspergillus sydowii CBS 593.65]OJJ53582.1 hypothetical protein ASPSYDRAFT_94782 [Aspergillus sydowii CBS 593.65]